MEDEKIFDLLKQGEILEVEKALKSVYRRNEKIIILQRLVDIFHDEVDEDVPRTVFDYSTDMDELSQHFTTTKLLLRRIEFDMPQEYISEMYDYFENNGVSVCMLKSIIMVNIFNKRKVCMGLEKLYSEKKGIQSAEAVYFGNLNKNIEED
jgi:hypothetical protein